MNLERSRHFSTGLLETAGSTSSHFDSFTAEQN